MHLPTYIKISLLSSAIALSSGCQLTTKPQLPPEPVISEQQKQDNQVLASAVIDDYGQWTLASSPMLQAYRGLKTNYSKWDDYSPEYEETLFEQTQVFLSRVNAINIAALDQPTALSIEILKRKLESSIDHYPYRLMNFPVNQMFGLHTQIPNFLMNIHQIENIEDARYFIDRVKSVDELVDQLITQLSLREQKGIRPPAFVYENVIAACEQYITGYPIDKSKIHNVVWSSYLKKIAPLGLYRTSSKILEDRLEYYLKRDFKQAYKKLISHLKQQQALASQDTGLHQFEGGKEFYNLQLKTVTTTNLTAEEIHTLGLNEIARIKQEITQLLPKLGQPSIAALFDFTRNEKDLYFKSKQEAIDTSKAFIQDMNKQLHKAFIDIPNIPMKVSAVESYREKSAPVAFYLSPSDDGKRPGSYYMNGAKLNEMPRFQFEALAYHETIPGHHLQTIYAQQSDVIPEFRRHNHFTAYSEGWGLYAETLAKELGGYQNPWNEYGRLLMELWRANRLVIDTGLHYYGWDIDQALAFRLENTPFSKEDSLNAIKRYIVMPGQATAYKIGQLKFLELKKLAEETLGGDFNLPAYHAYILNLGPLPLDVLEQEVKAWIQRQEA